MSLRVSQPLRSMSAHAWPELLPVVAGLRRAPLDGEGGRSAAARSPRLVAGVPAGVAVADGVAFLGSQTWPMVWSSSAPGWRGHWGAEAVLPEGTGRLADAEGVVAAAIPPRPTPGRPVRWATDAPAARARTMPAAATSAAPVRSDTEPDDAAAREPGQADQGDQEPGEHHGAGHDEASRQTRAVREERDRRRVHRRTTWHVGVKASEAERVRQGTQPIARALRALADAAHRRPAAVAHPVRSPYLDLARRVVQGVLGSWCSRRSVPPPCRPTDRTPRCGGTGVQPGSS